MTAKHLLRLAALGLAALTILVPADARRSSAAQRGFVMFDAIALSGKPDLSAYGFRPLPILDGHQLWDIKGGVVGHVPELARARTAMGQVVSPAGITVIDLEYWAPENGQPVPLEKVVQNYLATLRVMRAADPNMKFGLYGTVPIRDYWSAQSGPSSARYKAWQQKNDVLQPLADSADALFPSLYTFYPDQKGWRTYAIANLNEARRLAKGKPVYCFLWFQFHDSGAQAFQLIPGDYWRMELDTCHQYADGIVIWGGFTQPPGGVYHALPWDDNADWWKETVAFLRANNIH